MSKGTTPLYLNNVDEINGLLGSVAQHVNLPTHKCTIDRSGRNVSWLRKAVGRWDVTGLMSSTKDDVQQLKKLLEV
ncbi:hypothetical protein GR11A_00041 [Vibrio phage vB_VcorM_GR11A]|nr:hypothetical protein GR11A_00041 [Vibrio phage vB_VcorM_GR11A]